MCIQGCRTFCHDNTCNNNSVFTQAYQVSDEVFHCAKCWFNIRELCAFKSSRADVPVQTRPEFTKKTTCWVCVCISEKHIQREMKRRRYSSILMSACSCYCSFHFICDVGFFGFVFSVTSFLWYLLVLQSDWRPTASFPSNTPCDHFGTCHEP